MSATSSSESVRTYENPPPAPKPDPPFHGYPGFAAHPYREYSEVFFGDEHRVHDFAFDDRVLDQRTGRDLHDLGLRLRVVDDDQLDEAAADVETGGQFVTAEECHETVSR